MTTKNTKKVPVIILLLALLFFVSNVNSELGLFSTSIDLELGNSPLSINSCAYTLNPGLLNEFCISWLMVIIGGVLLVVIIK